MKEDSLLSKIQAKMKRNKYLKQCKKLNFSVDFLDRLIERKNTSLNVEAILEIILQSKNLETFKQNINNLITSNPKYFYRRELLIGNLIGRYEIYKVFSSGGDIPNVDNFNLEEKELLKILSNIKENIYEIIMSDNSYKNFFYEKEDKIINFTKDFSKEDVLKLFDHLINGNININPDDETKIGLLLAIVYKIVNEYKIEDLLNNFEFVKEDFMNFNKDIPYELKKETFEKNKNFSSQQRELLANVNVLKNKIKKIDTEAGRKLLQRIEEYMNSNPKIEELEEINLEYEIIYREDIVNRLYKPQESINLIEDFKELRPQLLHFFARDPSKFKDKELEKIKKMATSKEEYEKLVAGLEAKLNPTIVNHVADLDVVYSGSSGLGYYQSDTQNQISASIYSASFFAEDNVGNFLGIGFNADSITPESILMSSKKYMTTNAGVYNIDNSNDPNDYNSPYSELVENDGYSEVVLARRGEDFDSKAAYVFVAINSENIEGHSLYKKAKEYATQNSLKLVVYDLVKIRSSYKSFIKSSESLEKTQETRKVTI